MKKTFNLLWLQIKKKNTLTTIILLICNYLQAQTDTIYFDTNWKKNTQELATYYRIPPVKIKTKEAVGFKIKNIDSVYSIKDYYLKSHKLQYAGHSKDIAGLESVGYSQWFDENGNIINSYNNSYLYKSTSKLSLLDWKPIFYINYSITVKSQFTGGLEFCLSCQQDNKLFLGLGYGISRYNNEYFVLPDTYISFNTNGLLFAKIGGSNRNIYSLVGVSVLNLTDIGFGYSFPITNDKTPELKGFTFGITFRITNNSKAYIPLRIGF